MRRPASHAAGRTAGLWWLGDTAGAILFAACLAAFIASSTTKTLSAQARGLLAGIVASGLLRAGAQAMAGLTGQQAATRAKSALRSYVMAALLPSGQIRGRLIGEDLRVAVDDVEAHEGLIARFQPLRQAAMLSPLLIAVAVAFVSWFSALILLATLIPFGAGMALAGLAGKAEADRQFLALSRLSGLFVDRVAALPVILAFGAEDRVTRQIGGAAREVAARTMQVLKIAFVSSAMLEFFAALSVALVAVYCGFSLLGLLPFPAPEELSLGEAFFALALAPEFYLGMRRLAAAYHDKQQGQAAERSVAAALDQAHPIAPTASMVRPDPIRDLRAEGLTIRYDDDTCIGPITACWGAPGLHVVTGPTGVGKSSLLHALIGLARVSAGRIILNDADVTAGALMRLTGWAGQRPLLLPGTLADNLKLGSNDLPPQDLAHLIAASGLSDLIAARGEDLMIDPRGSGLSGGERRRIGLVRAIASGRPLLLLDEPTADLDPATAAQVIALLKDAARTRLVIAATHDPALIAEATSRVVMA
ncbi:MAG: ATP-binding cassette domain-containing protein [Novosphingobium sp.]